MRSAGTCPEPLSVGAGPRRGERELPGGWGIPAYSCGVPQSHPAARYPGASGLPQSPLAPWPVSLGRPDTRSTRLQPSVGRTPVAVRQACETQASPLSPAFLLGRARAAPGHGQVQLQPGVWPAVTLPESGTAGHPARIWSDRQLLCHMSPEARGLWLHVLPTGGPGLRLLCPLSPRPKVARWCRPAAGWLLPNCRVHRLPYQGSCEVRRTRCVPAQESAVAWTLRREQWLKLSAYTVVCSWDSLKVLIYQGFYLLFYNTF